MHEKKFACNLEGAVISQVTRFKSKKKITIDVLGYLNKMWILNLVNYNNYPSTRVITQIGCYQVVSHYNSIAKEKNKRFKKKYLRISKRDNRVSSL